ncbi:MAG: aspartate--ammonia ligase [Myxococcota bacterium]|nr:aspartate--ammonia ligase [Myxococcota bacterium]
MARAKTADLAGPGIGTYEEVEKILPRNYRALLAPMERMQAVYAVKSYIEENLARQLNLQMVPVPLIVDKESGVNDMLDRDGSRTPVGFPCGLGLEERLDAEVVQAATKWKRLALRQFDCAVGQGINTDMRAIRKDYFLDHDHSAYVDQWDWEKVIGPQDRNLDYLRASVEGIWKVIHGAAQFVCEQFPALAASRHPRIPEELQFFHAEEILDRYPDLPRKERENRMLQEVAPALFIIGIGWPLEDGFPHEMRAADYDDWITETVVRNGKQMHGLNGDILVWNPVTRRRHELSSMGIRVDKETLVQQMEMAGLQDDLKRPYHQAILNDRIPLSIGGGIGQSRTFMYLLRTAHLGEVSVSIWPKALQEICARHNIHVLE